MKRQFRHKFENIISLDNLLLAWTDFSRGKKYKPDVDKFQFYLMDNLWQLHQELADCTYRHSGYQAFCVNDPKPRKIHKATVRDRVVHRALYRTLYWFYHLLFISDSFSCRLGKGTHKALNRLRALAYRVSQNHTRTIWILQCDIRKFFENIDHNILLSLLEKKITDPDILWLLGEIIGSFGPGLPLGNLTSQLLVNIYLNEFDQFMKHQLKVKYYLRYADDFVIMSPDRQELLELLPLINQFLKQKLKLELHPQKVTIKTLASGTDFLGWVHFPDHRVLRTTTKRRMWQRLGKDNREEVGQSYLGLLQWGNTHKLKAALLDGGGGC